MQKAPNPCHIPDPRGSDPKSWDMESIIIISMLDKIFNLRIKPRLGILLFVFLLLLSQLLNGCWFRVLKSKNFSFSTISYFLHHLPKASKIPIPDTNPNPTVRHPNPILRYPNPRHHPNPTFRRHQPIPVKNQCYYEPIKKFHSLVLHERRAALQN